MNNNSIKLFAFSIAALSTTHIDTHAAAPASASSSRSSSSNRLALPILTAAQQKKLDAFKKAYKWEDPTTESIFNLVIQDNIHPDYIRYGYNNDDSNCALGWTIRFSRNLLLARYLLEHGANPNSFHYYAPVIILAKSVEAAQLLLEHGADPQACAKDLLPAIICHLSQQDPKLITLYIKHGADPDLTGGIISWHPMCSLSCNASLGAKEQECAQYLIEGGASLSYKVEDGGWKDYTSPLMLKQKLLDDQASAIKNHDSSLRDYYQTNYTDTQAFIVHVKRLADDRRKNVHALVAQHLPVANKNKIDSETFPLADLVTDYYEPEFDKMYNEPFPPAQAVSSSSLQARFIEQ